MIFGQISFIHSVQSEELAGVVGQEEQLLYGVDALIGETARRHLWIDVRRASQRIFTLPSIRL